MGQKIVINACFGGFGLSETAYEKLIEWGVPVRKYAKEQRDPETMLYAKNVENEGEVIFDREPTLLGEDPLNDIYHRYKGKSRMSERYWDRWTDKNRAHPLIVRLVEELGSVASGPYGDLRIVEIPDGVVWHIEEYDGREHIAENHRTWSATE